MARALVTGGGGFLGLFLVEQLVARGERVRVLCRGDYPRLRELGVEIVRGDIQDAEQVAAACAACDVVYHVAAVPGVWGPWRDYHAVNTQGTSHVLAGCWRHGVPKLVYTSSPSVVYDGHEHCGADESLPYATRFLCGYPWSKALAEQAVLAANGVRGLSTVALRPHLIWGPRDTHLVPRLLERGRLGQLARVGRGDNLISMSYVENAAAAHWQAAERLAPGAACAGRAYFINEPEPVRLWEWVDTLLGLAGVPPVTRRISLRTAYVAGAVLEGACTICGLRREPRMTRFLALQLGTSHYYSIAGAQRDCGYTPLVSVAEGLRRLQADLHRRGWGTPGAT